MSWPAEYWLGLMQDHPTALLEQSLLEQSLLRPVPVKWQPKDCIGSASRAQSWLDMGYSGGTLVACCLTCIST